MLFNTWVTDGISNKFFVIDIEERPNYYYCWHCDSWGNISVLTTIDPNDLEKEKFYESREPLLRELHKISMISSLFRAVE